MALPWKIIDSVSTEDEGTLQLRQRGARDFLITIGTQVLMNSAAHRSEVALGQLACAPLRDKPRPRVLVGGLGMGFTLRSVVDHLPATAQVVVAELNPVVVQWCQGPLAVLTNCVVNDPRVTVEIGDVAALIKRSAVGVGEAGFDAIVLDLYRGPHFYADAENDPLYGNKAIQAARQALKAEGILAVWGENYDERFEQRLQKAGFTVTVQRPGKGGLRHAVFLALRGK
ncbi:MAG: spermidine synthase [Desulfuromonadales bacterium]|nr:spermidine synthase [Desulfuromonadales bacterium]